MDATLRDTLVAKHLARWGFRPRGPFEGAQEYLDAVIAFLETRDWAASFEVRLGKVQADWTPEEVQAFGEYLHRPRNREPHATPLPALWTDLEIVFPVTLLSLFDIAHEAFEMLTKHRQTDPEASLPVLAHILTFEGNVLLTTVSSGNRLGVLKAAAQRLPLYGYVLVFDAFMHSVDAKQGTATKRDALIAHVGTREDRHILTRPYTVTGRRVTFDPETTMNMRTDLDPRQSFHDPYAELFVTVSPVTRPQ